MRCGPIVMAKRKEKEQVLDGIYRDANSGYPLKVAAPRNGVSYRTLCRWIADDITIRENIAKRIYKGSGSTYVARLEKLSKSNNENTAIKAIAMLMDLQHEREAQITQIEDSQDGALIEASYKLIEELEWRRQNTPVAQTKPPGLQSPIDTEQ